MKTALFGGGCFWEVEEVFRALDGVIDTEVGFAGGDVDAPSYELVYTDSTGHAEVVKIDFDEEKVSYEALLEIFFSNHNPTELNRQGEDVGTRYRSVVFFYDEEQRMKAQAAKDELASSGRFKRPIVTLIEPAAPFFKAEEYHQKYFHKKGINSCSI